MSSAAQETKSPSSSTSNSSSKSNTKELVEFESTRHMTFRPVVFQPNGSFKVLKETGKLKCEPHEAEVYKGRTRNDLADTAHFIPGYTGFVRGKQHIAGRTYGDSTRRALSSDYRDTVCQSPVPSSPQNNRKISQKPVDHTESKQYHIPGYTGFVPGVRSNFGRSYGSSTNAELQKFTETYGRNRDNSKIGFANTAYQRQSYKLDSNPLPGGSVTNDPPKMQVPSHLRYLRYMN